jgi:putative transposase
MAFWRLYYHIVWGTYQREPFLVGAIERCVYGALLSKSEELGIIVHAIGGMEDHVHLAVSIPPKVAVANCIRHLKGSSAYYVNRLHGADLRFRWQDGYGVLSFGERSLPQIVSYVLNQREHHRQGTLIALYEQMPETVQGSLIKRGTS